LEVRTNEWINGRKYLSLFFFFRIFNILHLTAIWENLLVIEESISLEHRIQWN
jgi:hypothetical protein